MSTLQTGPGQAGGATPPSGCSSWWWWRVLKVTGLTSATCCPHANVSLSKILNPKCVVELCVCGGDSSPLMSRRLPGSPALAQVCECEGGRASTGTQEQKGPTSKQPIVPLDGTDVTYMASSKCCCCQILFNIVLLKLQQKTLTPSFRSIYTATSEYNINHPPIKGR